MLFNNVPKQYLILECTLITGVKEYFYIENLAANTLNYLDTNRTPVRCYKIKDLYLGNTALILENLDKTKVINLHINNLLTYSNITKNILLMSLREYNEFITKNCITDCIHWKSPHCKLNIENTDDLGVHCNNIALLHNTPDNEKGGIIKVYSVWDGIKMFVHKLIKTIYKGGG